jgi:D-methionine transport system substrate-binding protein
MKRFFYFAKKIPSILKKSFWASVLLFSLLILFGGCVKSSNPTLKVAASSVPHAEILEFIKPDLQARNIELEILIIDDFNTPNRALADGEVDANFFQHLPFLEAQQADFGYQFEILSAVHLEPMALYSKKLSSLKEIKEKAIIAIPSDPSNQARALALCEQIGLITLENKGNKSSILDITHNPHQLKFIEIDSPLLSRALDDVDAAAISTNFAFLAGLSPKKDAIAIENGQSRYVNLVVVRQGENQRNELQLLRKALTSDHLRRFIENKYQGAVTPAF